MKERAIGMDDRLEIASRILAGIASAPGGYVRFLGESNWHRYALRIADGLLASEQSYPSPQGSAVNSIGELLRAATGVGVESKEKSLFSGEDGGTESENELIDRATDKERKQARCFRKAAAVYMRDGGQFLNQHGPEIVLQRMLDFFYRYREQEDIDFEPCPCCDSTEVAQALLCRNCGIRRWSSADLWTGEDFNTNGD